MAWAPDYATLPELQEYMRLGDGADAAELALAIVTASRAIDRVTHRQFGLVDAPEPRAYTARYDTYHGRWSVQTDDLMTEVGLAVWVDTALDGTYATPATAYALRPVNAAAKARPWTELLFRPGSGVQPTAVDAGVEITARWGWAEVPGPVRQACLLQASRLVSRRDSPYGIAGSPDAGSEMRLLAKVDPDVEVALADYVRGPGWWFS